MTPTFTGIRWCVPSAIAIAAGVDYDNAVLAIQEYLGDRPISGVYFPIALQVLKEKHGINHLRVSRVEKKGTFLCSTIGHMFIYKDGIVYDNHYPGGTVNKRGYLTSAQVIYRLEERSEV